MIINPILVSLKLSTVRLISSLVCKKLRKRSLEFRGDG